MTKVQWSDVWNLYINVSKCKVMHIGKRNPEVEYTMKLNNDAQKINTLVKKKISV